jgi:hypothetical protein
VRAICCVSLRNNWNRKGNSEASCNSMACGLVARMRRMLIVYDVCACCCCFRCTANRHAYAPLSLDDDLDGYDPDLPWWLKLANAQGTYGAPIYHMSAAERLTGMYAPRL